MKNFLYNLSQSETVANLDKIAGDYKKELVFLFTKGLIDYAIKPVVKIVKNASKSQTEEKKSALKQEMMNSLYEEKFPDLSALDEEGAFTIKVNPLAVEAARELHFQKSATAATTGSVTPDHLQDVTDISSLGPDKEMIVEGLVQHFAGKPIEKYEYKHTHSKLKEIDHSSYNMLLQGVKVKQEEALQHVIEGKSAFGRSIEEGVLNPGEWLTSDDEVKTKGWWLDLESANMATEELCSTEDLTYLEKSATLLDQLKKSRAESLTKMQNGDALFARVDDGDKILSNDDAVDPALFSTALEAVEHKEEKDVLAWYKNIHELQDQARENMNNPREGIFTPTSHVGDFVEAKVDPLLDSYFDETNRKKLASLKAILADDCAGFKRHLVSSEDVKNSQEIRKALIERIKNEGK